jgi:NAD(P)-dependent dehydrogenase (short-subunit alcohol dehydrogenase family)
MARFDSQVAIIIGGSKGLGRGAVEALRKQGARVLVIARDAEQLSAVAKETGAEAIPGDATDDALAGRLLRECKPDLVVLCAGASPPLGSVHEQTWESFSKNWGVDTKATFQWLRHALTVPMKPNSHIVVVSSGAAVRGSPVSGGYASAKRAQWFIADYAATESQRASLGLRIHVLLPALNPSTELGRAGIAAYAARAGVTPEEFAKKFHPPVTPEVMGQAVVDLHADPGRYDKLAYALAGTGLSPA